MTGPAPSGRRSILVPAADGKMRFWRGTSVASQPAGGVMTLGSGLVKLMNLLTRTYKDSRSLGISRACGSGGMDGGGLTTPRFSIS